MQTPPIMPSRYNVLSDTIAGYDKANVPLIGALDKVKGMPISQNVFLDGATLYPSGFADDIGSYYFIPKLVRLFNISLEAGINLFYFGIITLAFSLAVWATLGVVKTRWSKLIAIVGLLLLSLVLAKMGDVYVVLGATAMALIPWWLRLYESSASFNKMLLFFLAIGVIVGLSHFIRSHAGTGVLLFIGIMLLFSKKYSWQHKVSYLTATVVGIFFVVIYFGHLVQQRDNFLSSIDTNYQAPVNQHPFWHSIYIGFGFLNNQYGIVYLDEIAFEKASSVNDSIETYSKEYENILKKEVINLIITHPDFVLRTIFAKLGVCLLYLLIFANIGLLAALFNPKELLWQMAFGFGLGFNALFAVLIVPEIKYLLGFIAFAALYGIFSMSHVMDRGELNFVGRLIRKIMDKIAIK